MSRIKGGTTDEAFQALHVQCLLWEGGAPSAMDVGLMTTEGKEKSKCHNRSPLKKQKSIQLPAICALPPDNRRLPENRRLD